MADIQEQSQYDLHWNNNNNMSFNQNGKEVDILR